MTRGGDQCCFTMSPPFAHTAPTTRATISAAITPTGHTTLFTRITLIVERREVD